MIIIWQKLASINQLHTSTTTYLGERLGFNDLSHMHIPYRFPRDLLVSRDHSLHSGDGRVCNFGIHGNNKLTDKNQTKDEFLKVRYCTTSKNEKLNWVVNIVDQKMIQGWSEKGTIIRWLLTQQIVLLQLVGDLHV